MTDDEVRAALRRVRIGTPMEKFFRFAPAAVIAAGLLTPPVDSFERSLAWGLASGAVGVQVLLALRMRKDRFATGDERTLALRVLLEKRVKWNATAYPALVITFVGLGLLLAALQIQIVLSDRSLETLPTGIAITGISFVFAAALAYEHHVRIPELRRTLEALRASGPVGNPPPSA